MPWNREYLSPIILSLSLLLLQIPSRHYELYIENQGASVFYKLTDEAGSLLGALAAWLSALALHRYLPSAAIGIVCCYVYTAFTNIFIPDTYWAIFVSNATGSYCKSLLVILFTHRVAASAEKLSKSTNCSYKSTLQVFFALFYGISSSSYVFSSFMNLYLSKNHSNLGNILFEQMMENRTVGAPNCDLVNLTCTSFYPTNQSLNNNKVFTRLAQLYVPQSTLIFSITYVSLGVASGLIACGFWYAIAKCSLPARSPSTRSMFDMLRDLKFSFLVPCMMYSGVIEGYTFTDFLMLNIRCNGYEEHKELGVISYGAASVVTCCALWISSEYVNKVPRITATSLFQISVIILLIVYPGRVNHVAIFYVIMVLLAICVTLWHTQLAVVIAAMEPKKKLQGFANFFMFHSLGYIIAFGASITLCMSTRLYFLLGSAILAQFLYLVNEVEWRIYKISLQKGKPTNLIRRPMYNMANSLQTAQNIDSDESPEIKPMLDECKEDSKICPEKNGYNGETITVNIEHE